MPAYCFKPSIRQTWIFSYLIVGKSRKAIYWEGAAGVACWVFEPCYCRSPPVPPLVLPIYMTSAWCQNSRLRSWKTPSSWWALRLHSHLMFHSQAVSLLSKPGCKPRSISQKCNSSWKGGHAFIPKCHSCNYPVDPSPGLIEHPRLPKALQLGTISSDGPWAKWQSCLHCGLNQLKRLLLLSALLKLVAFWSPI